MGSLKHGSETEKKKPSKKLIITLCSVGGALLAAAAAVCVFLFVIKPAVGLEEPTNKQIKADLSADSALTSVAVGKNTYDFSITKAVIEDKNTETDEQTGEKTGFGCSVTLTRENEVYGIKPVKYAVSYKIENNKFVYGGATTEVTQPEFTAIAGIGQSYADKRVKKLYKNAKFAEEKLDLEKGVDKYVYKVSDKEYSGKAAVCYVFSSESGWKFKKINDKVEFKKGVTHQENGLYTNSNIKNILFLGVDSDSGAGRSDCMMLISIDSNTGTVKQTSFMRDNWFEIPGYGTNKLNSAYAFGGSDLTIKTIQNTFGIKIDHYIAVNFTTFKNVINAVGGVNINISADEAGYINWQLGKNGQSGVGYVQTSGGDVTLNGQQALWLCRDRGGNGFGGDDFTRSSRQRRVVRALISAFRNSSPAQVLATAKELYGNLKTDMSVSDIKWFADRSNHYFKYKLKEKCVPTDGEWSAGFSSGGAWIINLHDFPGLKTAVQKFIYEDIK